MATALRLCPGVVRVPARHERYAEYKETIQILSDAVLAFLLVASTEHGSRRYAAFANRYGIESLQSARFYGQRRADEGRFLASQIERGVLPDDILLSTPGAGALPYYTRWPTLDYLGLKQALETLQVEATVLAIAAGDLSSGKQISQSDLRRLDEAAKRVANVREVLYGRR